MAFNRGDIIEFTFEMPDTNKLDPHPALIISNQEVYDSDQCYICVMLTTSTRIDRFSFQITNEMLARPNNKPFSQARAHLITYVPERYFKGKQVVNKMKENSVNRLVEFINTVSLSVE